MSDDNIDWFAPDWQERYGRQRWWFDRQGNGIDVERWGILHEDQDYVRIGLDVWPPLEPDMPLDDPALVTISTVWLGHNHRFGPGPPLIFETMIFGGEFDQSQMRYSTEEQAEHGHRQTVEDFAAGRTPWFLVDDNEDARNGG